MMSKKSFWKKRQSYFLQSGPKKLWNIAITSNWTWLLWVIGVGIIIALGLYVYVSFKPESNPLLYHLFGLDSIKDHGTIFSNTSAPIVALGAAALMFLSFWAQYQANQRQWKWIKKQEAEKEFERIQSLINLINNDYNEIFDRLFDVNNRKDGYRFILMKLNSSIDKFQRKSIENREFISSINTSLFQLKSASTNLSVFQLLISEFNSAELERNRKEVIKIQLGILINKYRVLHNVQMTAGYLNQLKKVISSAPENDNIQSNLDIVILKELIEQFNILLQLLSELRDETDYLNPWWVR